MSNATLYFPIGGGGLASTTESNVQGHVQPATIVRNFGVDLSAALGTTIAANNTAVFTWRKNGSSQAVTCTVTNPATACADTAHSFTAAANDALDVQVVFTGTIAATPNFVMASQIGPSGGGSGSTTSGTFSALPSCTAAGSSYLFTDSYYTSALCDGAAWAYFAPGAGSVGLPPATGWSYVNQSGASLDASTGPAVWSLPTSGGSGRFILRTPAFTSPPWTYVMGMTVFAANSNFYDDGLVVRASGSGNFIAVALATGVTRFFPVGSTTDATGAGVLNSGGGIPLRFKITNDGTTVSAYISYTTQPTNWVLAGTDTAANLGTIDGVGLLAYKISNTSGFANLDMISLWDFRAFNTVQ